MTLFASLPMYWRKENAAQCRQFWRIVQEFAAGDGVVLPDLTPPEDIKAPWSDHWLDSDLALSMTCSLPFRTALRGRVTYVGTLHTDLDCTAGHYYSCIVRRKEDTTAPGNGKARLAYNAEDSQSGWMVTQLPPQNMQPPNITSYLETGSHAASAHAVAEGHADIAYIDATTWRLLERFDPITSSLQVVGRSAVTPSLPLITSLGTDPVPLRHAIQKATLAYDPDDPSLLGGSLVFTELSPNDYLAQPLPKSRAMITSG